MYDREYAREVLRMPVPHVPLRAADLHRQADVVAQAGTKRPNAQGGPSAAPPKRPATAGPVQKAPEQPAITSSKKIDDDDDDDADLWSHDGAEAASMALELELEEDLILRESQLAQELDE